MSSNVNPDKPAIYYKAHRPEVLKFIPETCNNVLEVGCGEGQFGEVIKTKYKAEVWGVEISEEAAEKAKKVLDKLVIGDFSHEVNNLPENYFDCIILNDVIEHLVDPFNMLNDVKRIMKKGGYIVSSIPNVRFLGNLKKLLVEKDWEYIDQGILDLTHLRFFTKKSIIRMFESLGYNVVKIEGINPTEKKLLFEFLNLIFFRSLSDTKFLQYVCVVTL